MHKEFSTNTNLIAFNREHISRDMDELIPIYAQYGIRNLDLNFCEMMRDDSRLNDKRAKDYIKRLKEEREEYGLAYIQAHAPYPVRGSAVYEWDARIIKALNLALELGIPHIVVHPVGKDIEENIRYYDRLIRESDITIAIENMESDEEISKHEEINTIIESNPKRLKALFDTGHAHMRKLDLAKEIKGYGKNLVGLHIHDNDGKSDQHLLPFMGTINWKEVVRALSEAGYSGYLTYEAMYYSRSLSINDQEKVIKDAINSFLHLL